MSRQQFVLFAGGAALLIGLYQATQLEAKVASYWEKRRPLRTARQEVGVAALDRHVYVIGGILAGGEATGIVERYLVDDDEWEVVAPLPDGRVGHHIGAAATNGRIYAIGGLDRTFRAVSDVFAFDPTTGEWEPLADLPEPRGACAVGADGDRIYVAGGQSASISFDELFIYLVLENRWIEGPPMRIPRNHLAGVVIDGLFFAVGGRNGGLRDAFEVFDPDANEWRDLPPLPTARGGIAAAAADARIFVFGGEGNRQDPDGIFSEVEMYSLCTERWSSELPMLTPRHGIGAAVVDERIYIPGGSPVEGFGTTDAHDFFVPGAAGSFDFLRGDADRDGALSITDAIFTLFVLFLAPVEFPCEDAADTDDSGSLGLTDAVFGLNYLFLGGPPPPPPGPALPGRDPTTGDPLSCLRPSEACAGR